MITIVFALIFVLGCLAIVLGFVANEYYGLVGLFLLFILSYVLMTGSLSVATGVTKNVTFTIENGTVVGQTEAEIDTYTPVDDSTTKQLARILAIAFGFGMAFLSYDIYINDKRRKEESL